MAGRAERLQRIIEQAKRAAAQTQEANLKAESTLTEIEQREQREAARQANR